MGPLLEQKEAVEKNSGSKHFVGSTSIPHFRRPQLPSHVALVRPPL